jgi:deoxyxylulose-5-phosphate synthase
MTKNQIIQVSVKNAEAFKVLQSLEDADLIQILTNKGVGYAEINDQSIRVEESEADYQVKSKKEKLKKTKETKKQEPPTLKNRNEQIPVISREKAERFYGILTKEEGASLMAHVKKMRNEWERT